MRRLSVMSDSLYFAYSAGKAERTESYIARTLSSRKG